MLHWIFRKSKKKKGFSLIELLVVVGIMGILAAVAIPAYNEYRRTAKSGVINATLTQIEKAFPSCLAVNTFAICTDANINNTLQAQEGLTIDFESDNTVATMRQRACWDLEFKDGSEGYTGCLDFENDNTGTVNLRFQGFPIGTACNDIASGDSCGGTGMLTLSAGSCPDGCSYTAGSCATMALVYAANTGMGCGNANRSTGSKNATCDGSGVCGIR